MISERIETIESLFDKYYESEDSFEQTDLAIELIQNHIGWLMEQAKKLERLDEYVDELEHEKQLLYKRLNDIRNLVVKKIK